MNEYRPLFARPPKKRQKQRKKRAWMLWLPCVLLLLYLFICWMPWRTLAEGSVFDSLQGFFIRNSRESRSYDWVQFAFPAYVRAPYIADDVRAREAQKDFRTEADPATIVFTPPADAAPAVNDAMTGDLTQEQQAFYETFYQLDFDSTEAYLAAHPEALAQGYAGLRLDRAGLDEDGLDIWTTGGEQVLAVDAVNGILLVRIQGERYRGVLAIAKDPQRLHLYTSADLLTDANETTGSGQTAGEIAAQHEGLLAITASGFLDESGVGTGGALAGFCRADGQNYGIHTAQNSKRLELREDHWLYVADANTVCGKDVTDAMEFEPALIVDGRRLEDYVYTGENPRACVGQTDRGEILMLAIEGRLPDSAGCNTGECTSILQRYRAITAMNMDGGTSAMLWYNGRPVLRCSNPLTPEGRQLPNAWVYK